MQKLFVVVLVLGLNLAWGTGVKGQATADTLRLSLDEAIKLGLDGNLTLKNSHIDYLRAQKQVWEVTAVGLPQASVTGSFQYTPEVAEMPMQYVNTSGLPTGSSPVVKDNVINMNIPLGSKTSSTLDAQVTQLIFSGEWIVGLMAANTYENLQGQMVEKSTFQTKENIISAYNSVLVIEEAYNNLNESLLAIEKLYLDMQAMNREGLTEDTDVDQLKITYNNLQTSVVNLRNQVQTTYMLLKIQLGLELDTPVKLTNSLDQLVLLAPEAALITEAFDVTGSVDYQIALSQEKISKLQVSREYSKFLPTLAGYYAYHDILSGGGSFDFQSQHTAGLKLSIPILTGGARLATLSQAKLNYKKAQNSSKLAEQGLITEFTAVRNSYLSNYNNYINIKETMELSERVYKKNTIKYREGMLSSIDLTNSQNQYLNAQKNYFEAQLSLLNAKANLDRILTKSTL